MELSHDDVHLANCPGTGHRKYNCDQICRGHPPFSPQGLRIVCQAGFPPGTVNLVSVFGKTVGSAIAHHMDVDKVAFTDSTATGRAIMRAAASSNLKKVTLELGSKSPVSNPSFDTQVNFIDMEWLIRLHNIIFPDADIDSAVDWSAWGINMNYGQTCHAGTRIYVHEDIYDVFLTKFTEKMRSITVGRPFDKATLIRDPKTAKCSMKRFWDTSSLDMKKVPQFTFVETQLRMTLVDITSNLQSSPMFALK